MADNYQQIIETDIVTKIADFDETKSPADCQPKHQDTHKINRAIERLGSPSIKQLATETGTSIDFVIKHVDWLRRLKKPKLRIERQSAHK